MQIIRHLHSTNERGRRFLACEMPRGGHFFHARRTGSTAAGKVCYFRRNFHSDPQQIHHHLMPMFPAIIIIFSQPNIELKKGEKKGKILNKQGPTQTQACRIADGTPGPCSPAARRELLTAAAAPAGSCTAWTPRSRSDCLYSFSFPRQA